MTESESLDSEFQARAQGRLPSESRVGLGRCRCVPQRFTVGAADRPGIAGKSGGLGPPPGTMLPVVPGPDCDKLD